MEKPFRVSGGALRVALLDHLVRIDPIPSLLSLLLLLLLLVVVVCVCFMFSSIISTIIIIIALIVHLIRITPVSSLDMSAILYLVCFVCVVLLSFICRDFLDHLIRITPVPGLGNVFLSLARTQRGESYTRGPL